MKFGILILSCVLSLSAFNAFGKIPDGTAVVTCDSKGSKLGGFSLSILADGQGKLTAVLNAKTVGGLLQISEYEINNVQTITHGWEKMYSGPGFVLNIEVGTPKSALSATLDHGRELNLEMICSY